VISSPSPSAGRTGCGIVRVVPGRAELLVVLAGEIDTDVRDALDAAVVAAAAADLPVHVDCTQVTYCGAEGLRLLVRLRDVCALRGLELSASRCVRDLLTMCGVEIRMRAWSG